MSYGRKDRFGVSMHELEEKRNHPGPGFYNTEHQNSIQAN